MGFGLAGVLAEVVGCFLVFDLVSSHSRLLRAREYDVVLLARFCFFVSPLCLVGRGLVVCWSAACVLVGLNGIFGSLGCLLDSCSNSLASGHFAEQR